MLLGESILRTEIFFVELLLFRGSISQFRKSGLRLAFEAVVIKELIESSAKCMTSCCEILGNMKTLRIYSKFIHLLQNLELFRKRIEMLKFN